ncbi:peroxiredoxin [Winogradskyella sp.]|uniref:peroxiredoxin n=1 Tax=Winogradskyella sp. TaxID=1883156 RepID=UPI003BABBE13
MKAIRIGDIAPDFKAQTTVGELCFHEWLEDSWGILLSFPSDFTPVCTTEMGTLAEYEIEFTARHTKVIALSIDHLETHKKWVNDINELYNVDIEFPIIADEDRSISQRYGMIHSNDTTNATVRSLFIIDPKKKVRLILTYPVSTGWNFYEIIRVLDSLQLTAHQHLATPANWELGDDLVILPSISNTEAVALFPNGIKEIKPYLRLTPQVFDDDHLVASF